MDTKIRKIFGGCLEFMFEQNTNSNNRTTNLMGRMMKINTSTISLIGLVALLPSASADIDWPLYSQQCRDDAGPPYADDEPGIKYHAGSAAYPVLENGECAQPLQSACSSRPDFKTAYLEGE